MRKLSAGILAAVAIAALLVFVTAEGSKAASTPDRDAVEQAPEAGRERSDDGRNVGEPPDRGGPVDVFEGWNNLPPWNAGTVSGVSAIIDFLNEVTNPPVWDTIAYYDPGSASRAPEVSKIVGGEPATPGDWPAQVIVTNSSFTSLCGGTLISDEWVLTAAHCVNPFDTHNVIVGAYSSTNGFNGTEGETISVDEQIVHPDYNDNLGGIGALDNDVAVLHLSQAVDYEPLGVVLPGQDELYDPGVDAVAVGWGTTSSGGQISDPLRQVTLPIVSDADCADAYPGGVIASHTVCAGDLINGGIDTCQGDSGGPLMVPAEGAGRGADGYVLAGVVSWGFGCAKPGLPGVYAEVANYVGWIEDETGLDLSGGGSQPMWLTTYKNAPLPSFNTLTSLNDGRSYWLFVTGDATIFGDASPTSTPTTEPTPSSTPTSEPTPSSTAGPPQETIQDGGFEEGDPNPFWANETDSSFGTNFCDPGCGDEDLAYQGDWFVWFGGLEEDENAYVAQEVTIPGGTATLSFYLWIYVDGTFDLDVTIDGESVFTLNETQAGPYEDDYARVEVDVSKYADGGSHELSFSVFTDQDDQGQDEEFMNVFLDEVSLLVQGP
jgi:hypothetical protein